MLKPGGRLFLMCFSDEEPGEQGPRRVSKEELHAAFAKGWVIESVEPGRGRTKPSQGKANVAHRAVFRVFHGDDLFPRPRVCS